MSSYLLFLFFAVSVLSEDLCPCDWTETVSKYNLPLTKGAVTYTITRGGHPCDPDGCSTDYITRNVYGGHHVYAGKSCSTACTLWTNWVVRAHCIKPDQMLPHYNKVLKYSSCPGSSSTSIEEFLTHADISTEQEGYFTPGYKVPGKHFYNWYNLGYALYCGISDFDQYFTLVYKDVEYNIFPTSGGCALSKFIIYQPNTGHFTGDLSEAGLFNRGTVTRSGPVAGMIILDHDWVYILDVGRLPNGGNMYGTPGFMVTSGYGGDIDFAYTITQDGFNIGYKYSAGGYVQYVDKIGRGYFQHSKYYQDKAIGRDWMYVKAPECTPHVFNPETQALGFEIPGKICPDDDKNYTITYDFYNNRISHITAFPLTYTYETESVLYPVSKELLTYGPCVLEYGNPSEYGIGCAPIYEGGRFFWGCLTLCVEVTFEGCLASDEVNPVELVKLPNGKFYEGYNDGFVKDKLFMKSSTVSCPLVDVTLQVHPDDLLGFPYYEDATIIGTFDVTSEGKVKEGDVCQMYQGVITCNKEMMGMILVGIITTEGPSTLSTETPDTTSTVLTTKITTLTTTHTPETTTVGVSSKFTSNITLLWLSSWLCSILFCFSL